MRPGEAMQSAEGDPLLRSFFNNFTQRKGSPPYSTVNCCMYSANGHCYSHSWRGRYGENIKTWNGMEGFSGSCTIGMLLDLDVGTLSVYKNGRKLGVMKRRLVGQYCWVVSMYERGSQVTIKRGTVPLSLGWVKELLLWWMMSDSCEAKTAFGLICTTEGRHKKRVFNVCIISDVKSLEETHIVKTIKYWLLQCCRTLYNLYSISLVMKRFT